jgi:hypothetical protein
MLFHANKNKTSLTALQKRPYGLEEVMPLQLPFELLPRGPQIDWQNLPPRNCQNSQELLF